MKCESVSQPNSESAFESRRPGWRSELARRAKSTHSIPRGSEITDLRIRRSALNCCAAPIPNLGVAIPRGAQWYIRSGLPQRFGLWYSPNRLLPALPGSLSSCWFLWGFGDKVHRGQLGHARAAVFRSPYLDQSRGIERIGAYARHRCMRVTFSKEFIFLMALWALPARAGDVAVTGQAGYLSEWEITATAHATTTGQRTEFAGPLVMKHVGVCTINGPVEKSGEIQFRRTGFLSSWIEGRLTFADELCTFRLRDGAPHEGIMECPRTRGVPLSLKVESQAP
jgi:hypothetical protein